jgi:hypothetical protein
MRLAGEIIAARPVAHVRILLFMVRNNANWLRLVDSSIASPERRGYD